MLIHLLMMIQGTSTIYQLTTLPGQLDLVRIARTFSLIRSTWLSRGWAIFWFHLYPAVRDSGVRSECTHGGGYNSLDERPSTCNIHWEGRPESLDLPFQRYVKEATVPDSERDYCCCWGWYVVGVQVCVWVGRCVHMTVLWRCVFMCYT